MDDLFRIPGDGCPRHICCNARFPLVSAAAHAMIILEVTDHRLDLDPLPERFAEPGLPAVRMGLLPLLGNGDSLDPPLPAAVLLFFVRRIKLL